MDQPDASTSASAPASKWARRGVRARWVVLGCYAALSAAWYVVFLSRWDPLGLAFQPRAGGFLAGTLVLFGFHWPLLLGAPQLPTLPGSDIELAR